MPVVRYLSSIVALLVAFAIGEIAIRSVGTWDIDGNFTVRGRALRPYRLPVERTRQRVRVYVENRSLTHLTADAVTGWRPRPSARSASGPYQYDASGTRTGPGERPRDDAGDALGIAIFGDSFTHGDELEYEDTWGAQLERALGQRGHPTRVYNFGVGGYGMDQAFLRWRDVGRHAGPEIVILGLQMENVKRNLNLVRAMLYIDSGLPFSKPRFFRTSSGLELANVPTVPPEQLVDLIAHFPRWKYAPLEYFYDPDDYRDRPWLHSKLLAMISSVVRSRVEGDFSYAIDDEPARLTLAIVSQFGREVAAAGSRFVVVHLATRSDLLALQRGRPWAYRELLDRLDERQELVRTGDLLLEAAPGGDVGPLFLESHYSATGAAAVALAIAEHMASTAPVAETVAHDPAH